MRRVISRAVAVLAIIAGIAVGTTAPAQAATQDQKFQPTTSRDWWF